MKHLTKILLIVVFLSNLAQAQTTITYDKLGRVTNILQDDGTEITYTYDAVGNKLTEVVTNTTLGIDDNELFDKRVILYHFRYSLTNTFYIKLFVVVRIWNTYTTTNIYR